MLEDSMKTFIKSNAVVLFLWIYKLENGQFWTMFSDNRTLSTILNIKDIMPDNIVIVWSLAVSFRQVKMTAVQ